MNDHDDLEALRAALKAVREFPWRLPRRDGRPGGLIELPNEADTVIVGDLHTNAEHLRMILDHDGNLDAIRRGDRILVLVGDLVHEERTGHMKEMESSIAIFDIMVRLMAEMPRGIVYLRGNHDTFDERVAKSGILQGKVFREAMKAAKGDEYTAAAQEFFDALPVFVIGTGFVVTHAGPARGGITRDELIHVEDFPDKLHQFVWNRVHEFRGTPSQKEYGQNDITLTLARLELPSDTIFVVGHNPLWATGERTGVWLDAVGIKNHHILYSGYGSRAPYFLIRQGKLNIRLAAATLERESYSWSPSGPS